VRRPPALSGDGNMSKAIFSWALLIIVLGVWVPAQDSKQDTRQIAWEADFDATLKAAKADGRPLFIAFIMDNEPANNEIVKDHFHHKDIVELSKQFHCLICCTGVHAGTSAEPCPKFGHCTCANHQNIEMKARGLYIGSTQASAPQFIFVKPDGQTILVRSVWAIGPGELLKKMKLAIGFNDPAHAGDEIKEHKAEVDRMLALADDRNAVKRGSALASLSTMDDPRIIDFLVKQTADNVEEARRLEAIDAMGKRGNAKALPVLLKLLASASMQIRNHSVIALEKLGMMEAGPALFEGLKKESKEALKGNLARALALCDPKPPDHTKAIIAMIGAGAQIERISAIRASLDVPMTDALKKALLTAATAQTAQVRGAAYYALARRQIKEAIPIIEKAIPQEKVVQVKHIAQSSLSDLKQTPYDGPNADDILKGWLVDEDLRKQ
jgi:hypothetical protein